MIDILFKEFSLVASAENIANVSSSLEHLHDAASDTCVECLFIPR